MAIPVHARGLSRNAAQLYRDILHGIDLEPMYHAQKNLQVLRTKPNTNHNDVQFVLGMISNAIERIEMTNRTGNAWRFVINDLAAFWMEAAVFLVVSPAIAYVSIGVTRMLIEDAVSQVAMRTILGAITLDILAAIFLASLVFWIYNVLAILAYKGYLYAFPLVGQNSGVYVSRCHWVRDAFVWELGQRQSVGCRPSIAISISNGIHYGKNVGSVFQ